MLRIARQMRCRRGAYALRKRKRRGRARDGVPGAQNGGEIGAACIVGEASDTAPELGVDASARRVPLARIIGERARQVRVQRRSRP